MEEAKDVTLVVIDMQRRFAAANDAQTREAVAREIRDARAKGWAIVVVEYREPDSGDPQDMTHGDLMQWLRRPAPYAHCQIVCKQQSDGSAEVITACKQRGFSTESFRCCGVNTDACVLATVEGLVYAFPTATVTVVRDACNSQWKIPQVWDWFVAQSNVVVTPQPASTVLQ